MDYLFIYDLEKEVEVKDDGWGHANDYCVRYYNSEEGIMVEIGDGYRHEIFLDAKYWNIILDIIKKDIAGKEGTDAIVYGLMRSGIYPEFIPNFINAIKDGRIKKA